MDQKEVINLLMRWNNIPSDITIEPMYQGKSTCETLKSIRKQIADANEIPYEPRVCTHKGDCMGTCPACESEMRYIENQLNIRKMAGKAVKIVGLATVMTMAACNSTNSTSETEQINIKIQDSVYVEGMIPISDEMLRMPPPPPTIDPISVDSDDFRLDE